MSDQVFLPVTGANGVYDMDGAAGTACFCYLGKLSAASTIEQVAFEVTTEAVDTVVCEVGLYSSTDLPVIAGQTLTRIAAGAVTDDMTASKGVFTNATPFATEIAAGTHIWSALRIVVSGGSADYPIVTACGNDLGKGINCVGAAAAALTHSTLATCAVTVAPFSEAATGPGPFIGAFLNV